MELRCVKLGVSGEAANQEGEGHSPEGSPAKRRRVAGHDDFSTSKKDCMNIDA